MPMMKVTGLEDTLAALAKLEGETEGVVKRAVYEGVSVLADAVRSHIDSIETAGPSDWERRRREEQKAGLKAGLTTYDIRSKGGYIEGGVGFTGYNALRQPNRKIARVFNSGTSFSRKQPFFSRAVRGARQAARQAVVTETEKNIEKYMKG